MRVTHHLAVLGLLGAMTLTGVGARWDDSATTVVLAAPSPAPVIGAGGSGTLSPFTVSQPVPISASPTALPTPVAAALPPALSNRTWVQNFKSTDLFDGPGPQAVRLRSAAQFSTFELLEQFEGGRSRLFDPGQGEGSLPMTVWASMTDFGPSGPPKYEFLLPKGGQVEEATGKRAPERTADAWPALPHAEGALVLDGESGAVLYAKGAHNRLPQASTTKIMTAIVALENGRLDDRFTVDVDSQQLYLTTESTVMGLMPGQTVSLETLLYGLMLSSGNDAAIAIAKRIGGTEARFVEMMNAKARQLGLRDTQFKNPHGLDADGHYSSPYDLAILARYGFQNPRFYALSSTRHWNADGFDLWNLNKLLPVYAGADGVKPGFTDNAGRCLVGSAVRDNRRVFVVALKSIDPTFDSISLLDYAFSSFRWSG
jgi:D-alanyl-D-alanine carboxypeptidase